MPPKKAGTKKKGKGETMSLAQFQQTVTEDSGEGSWGDRMSDDVEIPQAITTEELRETSGDSGYRRNNYQRRDEESYDRPPRREYRDETSTYDEYMSQPREQRERREPRARNADSNQLPTERPFVVYIGNLPFQDVTKDDIAEFFGGEIEHIVLPIDREREGRIKGHGYVEFVDIESYKQGLNKHDSQFMGRNIRVDMTDPDTAQRMCAGNKFSGDRFGGERREREPRPESVADKDSSWRGGGKTDASPFGNRRNERGDRGDRGDRYDRGGDRGGDRYGRERSNFDDRYSDRGDREPSNPFGGFKSRRGGFGGDRSDRRERGQYDEERQPEPTERPKINLKPRSVDEPSASPSSKSDIFGGGKAWEETDEIKKKLENLELKEKQSNEEAEKRFEEEKKRKQEEREKAREERQERPREPRSERREGDDNRGGKKKIDFSNFGKSSDRRREGDSRSDSRGESRGRGRDSGNNRPRYENEKKEDKPKEQPKDNKQQKKAADNRFGVLGEEDLE